MKNGLSIGNNGNRCVDVLHKEELLKDGMTAEEITELARPYMVNEKHLERDGFWEDVFCRSEELNYKLSY